jgi:hypothetical protein
MRSNGRKKTASLSAIVDLRPEFSIGRVQLIALTRVFFEFLLPVLVGIYAIYALLSRALL